MEKKLINIMWFKRDLRTQDNAALKAAIESASDEGKPRLLMIYIFEPALINDTHYSERHWRFIVESLESLNARISSSIPGQGYHYEQITSKEIGNDSEKHSANKRLIYLFHDDAVEILRQIFQDYKVCKIFSHAETGLRITYKRDLAVQRLCQEAKVNWIEYPTNSVIRGLKNKTSWSKYFDNMVSLPQEAPNFALLNYYALPEKWFSENKGSPLPNSWWVPNDNFQPGGETEGQQVLDSFLLYRAKNYTDSVPSPLLSIGGCSRLSPYIAWGCLSVRQVHQAMTLAKNQAKTLNPKLVRQFAKFAPRLKWQGQFLQQFESEDRIEFENARSSYDSIIKKVNTAHYQAWSTGHTGYPLIDACMRALIQTGYVNFRMRALLVSFLAHHLFQDWKQAAKHLASIFLDFEPGIHYAQIQMQSGMGYQKTIRIYNPVKQSYDNDENGVFIKKWVNELKDCPIAFIHEPWRMNAINQTKHKIIIGKDYPSPIIDFNETSKYARLMLYSNS